MIVITKEMKSKSKKQVQHESEFPFSLQHRHTNTHKQVVRNMKSIIKKFKNELFFSHTFKVSVSKSMLFLKREEYKSVNLETPQIQ